MKCYVEGNREIYYALDNIGLINAIFTVINFIIIGYCHYHMCY